MQLCPLCFLVASSIVFASAVGCGTDSSKSATDMSALEGDESHVDAANDSVSQCQQSAARCESSTAIWCDSGEEQRQECAPAGYCNFGECEESAFTLPDDAAPHADVIEWWYYTGHLTTGEREFGFEISLFQQRMEDLMGTTPPEGEEFGFMCHVALLDKDNKEHFYTQGISTKPRTWSSQPVVLDTMNCTLELSGDGHDHIVGVIPEGEEGKGLPGSWAFDLWVDAEKPVVHHGTDGVIPMAQGGDSYYYSFTRMTASGTVTTPDGSEDVTGQAWMDHQWGNFQTMDFKGWDWWSMQFDDGWEIMLFLFRDWDDVIVVKSGSVVDPEGNVHHLDGAGAFEVTSLREWSSEETDGVYPLDWNISIGELDWNLEVRTRFDAQEVPNFAKNYWEGAVEIAGTRGETSVGGVGYVELTGYATDIMAPQ